ncbi:MAG: PorP/SprF family type IX secretion system membrane protein [Saprospiraceae bacterium]|nr:PorP/SprF family type IX secretion system membrane protein [Saprospiraceae bacterium]
MLLPSMVGSSLLALSQDIHFSQFYNAPNLLNPALAGIFEGHIRFTANHRSQWQSVPVDYRTVSAAFDSKLQHHILGENSQLGYGLMFNNDVAGNANLGMSKLGVSLAYSRPVSDEISTSVGIQMAISQRSLSPDKLTYEEQWNGDVFDPNSTHTEAFNQTSKFIGSFATGLNLRWAANGTRTSIDIGGSLFHINEPNTSFFGEPTVLLPRKFNGYLLTSFELQPKMDFRANVLFSKQTAYREAVLNTAIRYHLNKDVGKELQVQLGISYRVGDALIPTTEIQYRNWAAGFSYDINLSPFKVATNRRGGPEIFLQYILKKVEPPKEFKSCPVF